jgi:hypothetical protein
MPGGGLQLQRKHVAVNKLINTGFVLDWFNTYTCEDEGN